MFIFNNYDSKKEINPEVIYFAKDVRDWEDIITIAAGSFGVLGGGTPFPC